MKYTVDKPQRPINRSIFGTSSYLKAYVYRPTGLPGVLLDLLYLPAFREPVWTALSLFLTVSSSLWKPVIDPAAPVGL